MLLLHCISSLGQHSRVMVWCFEDPFGWWVGNNNAKRHPTLEEVFCSRDRITRHNQRTGHQPTSSGSTVDTHTHTHTQQQPTAGTLGRRRQAIIIIPMKNLHNNKRNVFPGNRLPIFPSPFPHWSAQNPGPEPGLRRRSIDGAESLWVHKIYYLM